MSVRRIASALTLLVIIIGCDAGLAELRELADFAEPLLLTGYTDLRVERESPAVGISVLSYKLPPGMSHGVAVTALRDQMKRKYPCYEVMSESEGAVQLRCLDAPGRLHLSDGDPRAGR